MPTTQFNVRLDVALATKLRREAKRRRQTPGVLVGEAIELLLSSANPEAQRPLSADSKGLAAQLAALEQRVALLEQGAPAAASAPSPPSAPAPLKALPDRRLTPGEAEGLLTCPQVAELLKLKTPSSITNWIARGNGPGSVYRGWQLVGKGLLPHGQQPGWLFRSAG